VPVLFRVSRSPGLLAAKCKILGALETCWFKAGNILLVYPQRQKYNLDVSENAVSTYKSAIYIEKQQQVSAGVI
jgi:hypothetical protein